MVPVVAFSHARFVSYTGNDPLCWGVGSPSDRCPKWGTVMPLEELLSTSWDTDVHFAPYQLEPEVLAGLRSAWGKGGDAHPRLAKSTSRLGVTCSVLCFDYDNPGHAVWSDSLRLAFDRKVYDLRDRVPPWDHMYLTRAGARFLYVCEEPVGCKLYERAGAKVRDDFLRAGLVLDAACCDWTRLYRAPDVVRD